MIAHTGSAYPVNNRRGSTPGKCDLHQVGAGPLANSHLFLPAFNLKVKNCLRPHTLHKGQTHCFPSVFLQLQLSTGSHYYLTFARSFSV